MIIGLVSFALYIGCIPAANWLIENVGTVCFPNGPCVVPVFPGGVYCPTGSLMIGFALVLRDVVQRAFGKWVSLLAIVIGAGVSFMLSPPELVVASVAAFFFSELADFAVYTPLYRRRFITAIVASAAVGLVVDSILFLWIAFGSQELLLGLVIGKSWMVLAALPVMFAVRSHFDRLDKVAMTHIGGNRYRFRDRLERRIGEV